MRTLLENQVVISKCFWHKRDLLSRSIVYTVVLGLIISLTSCNVLKKNLEPGKRIINSHDIKIIDKVDPVDDRNALKTELELLVKPRPDGKLLGIRTKVSDPAPLLNEEILQHNIENILANLKEKGYREAEASYKVKLKGKRVANVKYTIHTNKLLRINKLYVFSKDTSIQKILEKDIIADQRIQPGSALSIDNVNLQKGQIVNTLRNQGYARFFPNYIDVLRGNKSTGNYQMEVLLLNDSITHKTYDIGDMHVYLRDPSPDVKLTNTESHDGIVYHFSGDKPYIKLPVLNRKIEFRPNDLYSKAKIDESRVLLGDVPYLRNVSIANTIRNDSTDIIDYAISLDRNQRYNINLGIRSGYAFITGGDDRIGFTTGATFTDRNIFGGGESLILDYSGGIDLNLFVDSSALINTNFQFNHDLSVPSAIDLFGTYGLLHNIGIINKPFYDKFKLKGKTNFEANLQFLNLKDAYAFTNYEINYGHKLKLRNTSYDIVQSGFVYLNSDIDSSFIDQQVSSNPNIIRSLESRILSGLLFRTFNMTYQSPVSRRGSQWTFLGTVDASGHEVFAVNQLYRWISGDDVEFSINNIGGEKLRFAQYLKLDLDTRYSIPFLEASSLTFRLATGIALPYGFSDDGNVVPYLNQFDAGGPYSLRAWDQRELGPGGVPPSGTGTNTIFAQKGDIRLETNIEYRFLIGSILEGIKLRGALFLDAGNVWLINSLPNPPPNFKGVFSSDFYKEIAFGGGYGLRFDFDYFVIRFDFGYQFRRPYEDSDGNNWVIDKLSLTPNLNFAVGYPF